jgi:hypothetical protein
MIGASINEPSCFPFLKAGKEGPPVQAGGPFSFSFLGLFIIQFGCWPVSDLSGRF